jgi:hypothetical protein
MQKVEYLKIRAANDSLDCPGAVHVVKFGDYEDEYSLVYYPTDENVVASFVDGEQVFPKNKVKEEKIFIPKFAQKEHFVDQNITVRMRCSTKGKGEVAICKNGVPLITFNSAESMKALGNTLKYMSWDIYQWHSQGLLDDNWNTRRY